MRVSRARALVFSGVAVVAFLAALGPIADGDIYWHLAAGRRMLHDHALLRTDPFTLSAAGRSWVDVHWLFQLGVAAIHQVAGFMGLTILKAVLISVAALVLTRSAERAGGPRARLLCALSLGAGLIAARHLLPLRPVIVTVLFLALTLDALEAWRTGVGTSRRPLTWLLALPALQIVWVNCQGLAPLGPALIGAYLVGAMLSRAVGRRRATEGAGAEPVPQQLRPLLARLAPSAQNVFSVSVAENIPPFVLARTAPEQIAHFTLALVATGVALAVRRPRVPAAHVIILGGFLALALAACRNIVLFYVMAAPILALALTSSRASREARDGTLGGKFLRARRALASVTAFARVALPRVGGVILVGEVMLAGVAIAREAPVAKPTPFRFPTESARRLIERGATGPVFAPDHQGGFLTFTLPTVRPYIDTRLILHSAAEYADYLSLLDAPERFDVVAAREGFRYVVLTTSNPDRYLTLAAHLVDDPAWSLVYTDGSEMLFARATEAGGISLRDSASVDAIQAELRGRFPGDTAMARAATLNLARLLTVVGAPREAERVLATDDSRPAAALRARARFVAGDLGAAETLARLLLVGHERDTSDLALLGEIAFQRRRADESRAWVRRALAVDPYAPEARSLLARIEGGALTSATPSPPARP